MRTIWVVVGSIATLLALRAPAAAAEAEGEKGGEQGEAPGDLAKAVQNPIADLISVPFQNNTSYNIGPNQRASNTLNIQPVIPVHLSDRILLVTRTILPITYQPDLTSTGGGTSGVSDLSSSFFLSPAKPGKIMWGVGPIVVLPTATQRAVGTGRWSAGPTAVALMQPGDWTFGVLVNQAWSFAGPANRANVSAMTVQYFINYNLPDAWYLSSSPILTFNWKASSSEEWVVPVGGGVGKIFKLGKLPLNGTVQGFYNIRPEDSQTIGHWQARVQLAFLFPTAKPKPKPTEEDETHQQARCAPPAPSPATAMH
jgi:hypothetical protein